MKRILLVCLVASLVLSNQSFGETKRTKTAETATLQTELTKLGYYHGQIDGYLGLETQAARDRAASEGKSLIPLPPQVVYKLSPAQRKLAIKARAELDQAIAGQTAARAEADQAKQHAIASDSSAKTADDKAAVAEAKAKKEHDELVRAAKENAEMRPIVDKVNSYWGLGAILYGFGRLFKHLFIATIVLVIIGVLIFVFAPWLRPIFSGVGKIIGSLLGVIGSAIESFLHRVPDIVSALFAKFKKRHKATTNLDTQAIQDSVESNYE